MEVSLSQLIQLKKRLAEEISNSRSEFIQGAYTEVTADVETDAISVEEFEAAQHKLLELHDLHLSVALLVTKLNAQVKVMDGEKEMPIQQAILHAQFLRDYARAYKTLGAQKKTAIGSTGNGLRSGEKVVVERHYDIKQMLKDNKQLLLQADRLSRAIERASVTTTIDTAQTPELQGVEEYL